MHPHCRPYLRARSRTSPRPWPLWRSTRSAGSARTRWPRSGALMVPRSPRRPAAWVANRYPKSSGAWEGAGRCPRSRTSARALADRQFEQGAVLTVTEEGPMSNAHPARGFLLAAALLTALPAAGAVIRFPGGAPCNTTAQACIDGAAPGDVVELATTDPIAETLQVTKSLTLRPATGFTPVIADLNAIRLLNPAHAANTIVVESLRLTRGFVS